MIWYLWYFENSSLVNPMVYIIKCGKYHIYPGGPLAPMELGTTWGGGLQHWIDWGTLLMYVSSTWCMYRVPGSLNAHCRGHEKWRPRQLNSVATTALSRLNICEWRVKIYKSIILIIYIIIVTYVWTQLWYCTTFPHNNITFNPRFPPFYTTLMYICTANPFVSAIPPIIPKG
jgi:hypothetical protein